MSDSPSVAERLASLEAKTSQVLDEISILRCSFAELEKFLVNHSNEIERIKVELKLVKTIGIWIFAPLLGTVGSGVALAVFYALRWHR